MMSTPVARRSFWRFWFPLLLPVLASLVIATLWAWPNEEYERVNRVAGSLMTLQALLVLLALWLLVLSGLRWWVRLGVLAAVLGLGLASVRGVRFSGDMVPEFEWRWGTPPESVLEAHRRQNARPAAPAELTFRPTDYPEYRNTKRDGVVTGPPLARDGQAQPPRQVWRQPAGGGYASFAVVGNVAVTIEQRRDDEAVVCYDTATGRERWVHSYPARFTEALGGEGPRATPTLTGGDVFSLGAQGRLLCLDAVTGKEKWSANVLEINKNIAWAMSGSPLVYDNVVVVTPGANQPSAAGFGVIAYNRANGKLAWHAGTHRGGYASPMLATLAGKRQVLVFDGEGVAGYDAADGKELWRHPWETQMDINVAQPLVLDGDRVFVSSGYGVGCALLKVNADGTAKELWRNKNLRCRFTSPVYYQGHIYGLDEGVLTCLDVETGQRAWHDGRYGHGQLLLQDDLLVVLAENGRLVLVQATPAGHHELGSIPAVEGKTWNYPALADGRAYVRNHLEMACYDLREAAPAAP